MDLLTIPIYIITFSYRWIFIHFNLSLIFKKGLRVFSDRINSIKTLSSWSDICVLSTELTKYVQLPNRPFISQFLEYGIVSYALGRHVSVKER